MSTRPLVLSSHISHITPDSSSTCIWFRHLTPANTSFLQHSSNKGIVILFLLWFLRSYTHVNLPTSIPAKAIWGSGESLEVEYEVDAEVGLRHWIRSVTKVGDEDSQRRQPKCWWNWCYVSVTIYTLGLFWNILEIWGPTCNLKLGVWNLKNMDSH